MVIPWVNGLDVMREAPGVWIIDFGIDMPEEVAALYEAPFAHLARCVRTVRAGNKRAAYAEKWWIHAEPRPAMRAALAGYRRLLATPTVAKHRIFVWLPSGTLPDHQLIVFARDDDFTFGVLHSAIHEAWARKKGTQVRDYGSGFRYTPTTTFETYPFPVPAPAHRARIVAAASELQRLREGWLNPPGASPAEFGRRTLTNLYNERPTWLENAHLALDRSVLAAYGWPEAWAEGLQPVRDENGKVNPALGVADPAVEQDVLARLLALNLEQSGGVCRGT